MLVDNLLVLVVFQVLIILSRQEGVVEVTFHVMVVLAVVADIIHPVQVIHQAQALPKEIMEAVVMEMAA